MSFFNEENLLLLCVVFFYWGWLVFFPMSFMKLRSSLSQVFNTAFVYIKQILLICGVHRKYFVISRNNKVILILEIKLTKMLKFNFKQLVVCEQLRLISEL